MSCYLLGMVGRVRSSIPYYCVRDIPMVGGILVRGIVGDHSVLRGRMGDGSWLGSLAGGLDVEMGKGQFYGHI